MVYQRPSGQLEAIFLEIGVFKEKQLVRMLDNKLLTELCDSFACGIRTTNKGILDSLYKNHDGVFSEKDDFYGRLTTTFTLIRQMEEIHDSALMKPYMVYSLAQAITHCLKPVPKLNPQFKSPKLKPAEVGAALPNLSALAQAAEQDEPEGKFAEFIEASNEKTNTRENRITRFRWFCRALTSEHL
jgi:hypothetical protein